MFTNSVPRPLSNTCIPNLHFIPNLLGDSELSCGSSLCGPCPAGGGLRSLQRAVRHLSEPQAERLQTLPPSTQ